MTIDPAVLIAVIGTLAAAIGTTAKIVYSDMKRDRDYWRELALTGTRLADNATTVAVRKRRDG